MVPRLRYKQGRPAEERPGPGARAWLAIIATVAATVVLVASFPSIGYALLAAEFVLAALIGLSTLGFMLYGWRDPDGLAETAFPPPVGVEPRHSFSLIVPARHEEAVLAATLRKLAQQEYGEVEVIVVVGHDDPGTERVAREAVVDDPRFKVVVDDSSAKNKPRALNAALPHCTGDVVGVFDAEDIVAPGLLRATDEVFQRSGADVVQGAVALMNLHTSWFSVRNVLEYYFWFKSRLHFHAKHGYIPLGGNTVFVKRDWLTSHGGWDGDCLAEDCELGTRLSVLGARTVVAYSSELVTREETPATLPELLRQRTRWNQGFLQVLRKRQWTRLPLRSRGLALYTLGFPVLQALLGLSVPLAIAMALFVQLPILLALLSFVPLAALGAILVAELVGLAHFCREFSLRARPLDYLRLVIGSIPYQVLLSAAALRAGWREMYRVNDWEKTAHVGAHL